MAQKREEKTKNKTKDQLLSDVVKQIEKEYGKGSIMKLGERTGVDVEPIPSGSLLLDKALGIGGYPKGRIIEIYGPESSGKTTLALHAIAEVQKKGGRAAFIDAENAIDPVYAKHLGVNIDELILSQPDSGEQALNIMMMLIESGAVDLVVIDSVAALVPQAELDGEMGELQVGAQARMMSKAMRKIAGIMNHYDCTAIFINQLRMKVGTVYGNPETTPGGFALKFYSSVRIEIRKSEAIKNGAEVIGNKVNVKIVKNKVAAPFRKCQLEITYGQGLSALSELIDLAVDYDIIKKSGSWYSYQGDKIGQGKEASKEFLKSNPEIRDEIQKKIQELFLNSSLSDDIDQADAAKARAADDDLIDFGDDLDEDDFANIDLETGEIIES
ncbi:recombinase RecA [Allobaculum mucilyticum]|uniref:recombinase RecA n=1 Tax=Allobaculum mucilyticum TaxID=2834459 RepID=UPI001E625B92|nr:recombinase RecA [Allobaculum mucilyticum]UNT97444.1 recombinase RecA [Allobaculum mucilyticum]